MSLKTVFVRFKKTLPAAFFMLPASLIDKGSSFKANSGRYEKEKFFIKKNLNYVTLKVFHLKAS